MRPTRFTVFTLSLCLCQLANAQSPIEGFGEAAEAYVSGFGASEYLRKTHCVTYGVAHSSQALEGSNSALIQSLFPPIQMTYAIFKYDRNKEATAWIEDISNVLLLQKSTLKGFDVPLYRINCKKLENLSVEVLMGIACCMEVSKNAVSIVKFKDGLESDEYLLTFGEKYFGCLTEKPTKADLIENIVIRRIKFFNRNPEQRLKFDIKSLAAELKSDYGVTEDELLQLEEINTKNQKLIAKWVQEWKKRMGNREKTLPRLIRRDFSS